jgi:uncharacterized phage protein (TIGR01671 family)
MREIRFRGQRKDDNQWEYGFLTVTPKDGYVIVNGDGMGLLFINPIKPETIGQFTGLKDKNGVEVYEGDIAINFLGVKGVIRFGSFQDLECYNDGICPNGWWGWYLEYPDGRCSGLDDKTKEWLEVVGNIWDNPELLDA